MKRHTYALVALFALLAVPVVAQTMVVKIIFKNPPSGNFSYQLPSTTGNAFAVRVPKVYAPLVEAASSVTVTRSEDGDAFVFSFPVAATASPQIRATAEGLEINLGASSGAPAAVVNEVLPVTAASVAATPSAGAGQPVATSSGQASGAGQEEGPKIDRASVDLSVPESPGFTILGLTPETVIRPTSPRHFATSLLNGVDPNGNFQSGIAIDTAPFLLLYGNDFTINEYRASYLKRLLARTQFSLATVKGASEDDKSAKLGMGLHFTLYDSADPRTDPKLEDCLIQAFRRIPQVAFSPTNRDIQNRIDERTELLQKAAEACRASWRENLKQTSWVVGTAGSWLSPTGETKNFDWNGGAVWTSFSLGLHQNAQFILHLRHRTNEQVPDPEMEGKFFEKDSTLAGGRLRFGRPTFAGNAEAVFSRDKRAGVAADNNFRLSVGAERKIAANLYFNVSVGGETKHRDGTGNKAFVLTTFKWGYAKDSSQ